MALIDKLAPDADGSIQIASHTFSAATYLWAIGEITRAQVIAGLELEASDEPQLDQLATYYQGLTAGEKREFHARLESCNILLQESLLTKSQYMNLLGMT